MATTLSKRKSAVRFSISQYVNTMLWSFGQPCTPMDFFRLMVNAVDRDAAERLCGRLFTPDKVLTVGPVDYCVADLDKHLRIQKEDGSAFPWTREVVFFDERKLPEDVMLWLRKWEELCFDVAVCVSTFNWMVDVAAEQHGLDCRQFASLLGDEHIHLMAKVLGGENWWGENMPTRPSNRAASIFDKNQMRCFYSTLNYAARGAVVLESRVPTFWFYSERKHDDLSHIRRV